MRGGHAKLTTGDFLLQRFEAGALLKQEAENTRQTVEQIADDERFGRIAFAYPEQPVERGAKAQVLFRKIMRLRPKMPAKGLLALGGRC